MTTPPQPPRRKHRALLIALIVVNAMVLLGRIWPEGAPPFAPAVDLGFLVVSLVYFATALRRLYP